MGADQDKPYTGSADLWSLGIICYELFTGARQSHIAASCIMWECEPGCSQELLRNQGDQVPTQDSRFCCRSSIFGSKLMRKEADKYLDVSTQLPALPSKVELCLGLEVVVLTRADGASATTGGTTAH
eukprot:4838650-Amphidinium_carterae.1